VVEFASILGLLGLKFLGVRRRLSEIVGFNKQGIGELSPACQFYGKQSSS
jgi:hypothetical protein